MIVALSRFTIANDMAPQVREAFRQRPHLVDNASGFLGMEVMSPIDKPAEIWLVIRGSASARRNSKPGWRTWARSTRPPNAAAAASASDWQFANAWRN